MGRSPRSSPRTGKPSTWQRGAASLAARERHVRRPLVNTDEPWPSLEEAEARVLRIQTKLHQWATDDPGCRFDDLFNLVVDPAFLVVAWERVRANKGGRTAGWMGSHHAPSLRLQGCSPGCEPSSRPGRSTPCPCWRC